MRNIFVISIFALMECAPIDNDVEIVKQNIVRFPDDSNSFNSPQTDTQRILEEIEKINIKLGYTKFKNPSLTHNSNQYIYSKPLLNSFGIGLIGGGKLEPSIRSIKINDLPKRKEEISTTKYFHIPLNLLRMSKNKFIEFSNASVFQTNGYKIIGSFDNNNNLLTNNKNTSNNNVKVILIPFSKLNQQEIINKSKENSPSNHKWEAINVKKFKDISSKLVERTISNNNQIPKPLNDNKPSATFNNIPKPIHQNKPSVILQSIKSSINSLINKPTLKPVKQNTIADKQKNSSLIQTSDEYYNDSEEKTFLSSIKKQTLKDQNETLKDGGIIIQRLKVRKGGIAIAGPGGIATAGSGGTAIVGPGGFALTHPKSLTIAGPGAKILAYPSETDLKEILLNTGNGDELLNNGKIVATGPAIYYNNGS
ncbi:hypothetical protein ACFFRR_005334 [Megaselia abdita]